MKPRITHLAIFLILGSIANIAISWACALWSEEPMESAMVENEPFQMNGSWWFVAQWRYFGTQVYAYRPFPTKEAVYEYISFLELKDSYKGGNLPSWLRLPCVDSYGDTLSGPFLVGVGRGWPLISLSYGLDTQVEGDLVLPVSRVSSGIIIGEYRQRIAGFPRVVPFRPIWPGFALNTLLFASLSWLLFLGPFQLRRHIRYKRGACLKCGYDLRHADHKVCPECGWQRTVEASV